MVPSPGRRTGELLHHQPVVHDHGEQLLSARHSPGSLTPPGQFADMPALAYHHQLRVLMVDEAQCAELGHGMWLGRQTTYSEARCVTPGLRAQSRSRWFVPKSRM